MSYIITVIANNPIADQSHIDKAFAHFDAEHIDYNKQVSWVAPNKAFDIPVTKKLSRPQLGQLRSILAGEEIDCFQSPAENRRKKLFIADMDSTILKGETLDALARAFGLEDKIAAITEKAMNGEIDFFDAVRERVSMLKGITQDQIAQAIGQLELNKGAKELIKTLKENGVKTVLVSGGFTQFAHWVGDECGFDHVHANHLVLDDDGALTGEVKDPILDAQTKEDLLIHYTRMYQFNDDDTIAVGDGANDLNMINKAAIGVGYYAKPILAKKCENNIWQTDLMSLAYIQGLS